MEDIKKESDSEAESIILSDNDSDYEPQPKKRKVTKKTAKPISDKVKKVKPPKVKKVKSPKVKKTPVKRKRAVAKETKTTSKKTKIQDHVKNETVSMKFYFCCNHFYIFLKVYGSFAQINLNYISFYKIKLISLMLKFNK